MKFQYLFLYSLLLFSCTSNDQVEGSGIFVEKFPDVNLNDFDTIQFEQKLEFIIPKTYSITTTKSDLAVLAYSQLVDEVTVELCGHDKKEYQKSIEARGIKVGNDSLFVKFANESYKQSINSLIDVVEQEKYPSSYNELNSLYYRVTCKRNGFPFEQSLSIRYYEGQDYYYEVRFNSLASDAVKLSEIEDAVMLSFTLL